MTEFPIVLHDHLAWLVGRTIVKRFRRLEIECPRPRRGCEIQFVEGGEDRARGRALGVSSGSEATGDDSERESR